MRLCYSSVSGGDFQVNISHMAAVLVSLEPEQIEKFVPPPPTLIRYTLGKSYVVFEAPVRRFTQEPAASIVTRSGQRLTFRFRWSPEDFDTQIKVIRVGRDAYEETIEARVKERVAELEQQHAQKLRTLDEEATRRGRSWLLSNLTRLDRGPRVAPLSGRAWNDRMRIRTDWQTRLGENLWIIGIRVDMRIFEPAKLAPTVVEIQRGKARQRTWSMTECQRRDIPKGGETRCTVAVSLPAGSRGPATLRFTVRDELRGRTVSLDGVRVQ
jgi:hypothetical protein